MNLTTEGIWETGIESRTCTPTAHRVLVYNIRQGNNFGCPNYRWIDKKVVQDMQWVLIVVKESFNWSGWDDAETTYWCRVKAAEIPT